MKLKTLSESPNFDGAGGAFEEREGKWGRPRVGWLRLRELIEEVTLGTSLNDY